MDIQDRIEQTDRITNWTQHWALSFSFAITQSVELSEEIISQSIALLLTPTNSASFLSQTRSTQALFFAKAIWGLASEQAYRGFGSDVFFKMPVLTRAVVVLKTRAQFSCEQISKVLETPVYRIEDLLENARLLFSEGKNWISPLNSATSKAGLTSGLLNYGCTSWTKLAKGEGYKIESTLQASKDLQELFSKYLGNDLSRDTSPRVHAHLLACESCRNQFIQFKTHYQNWITTVPMVELDDHMKEQLQSISKTALKLKRTANSFHPPSLWISVQRMVANNKSRAELVALMLGASTAFVVISILKHRF